MQEQGLIEKIRQLPLDKQTEVEDLVEFLKHRDADLRLTQAAARLSEEAFRQVWDNREKACHTQARRVIGCCEGLKKALHEILAR